MHLRPYQTDAVKAVYDHLRNNETNPVVVIPTAGGKTPVMAQICHDAIGKWDGKVLILAHVKELLEQSHKSLAQLSPELLFQIVMYSAGLNRRDTKRPITIAGIQSVYKRAFDLESFDLILVDEAHMIPQDGEGMYRTFLDDAYKVNPNLRIIGLTATPFRMKSGMICGEENIFNHVCYEIGIRELIVNGFLCKLTSKAGEREPDVSELHVRAGEYIASEAQQLMDQDDLVDSACEEILDYTARNRRSVLIFATGIHHAEHVADTLGHHIGKPDSVACVFGHTPNNLRDEVLEGFRAGRIKYLVNVNVLTTGFDAPNIDCICLLRPTLSPGLYYQMVGRGFRIHPQKADCLVLDYGGNIMRHGPVDSIRIKDAPKKSNGEAPAKKCPECRSLIHAGYQVCPDCGYEFPPPDANKHAAQATTQGILSGTVTIETHEVLGVIYVVHTKANAELGAPKTMRVDYRVGFETYRSEWICFEHEGWARAKAQSWWNLRSRAPVPTWALAAVDLADNGAVAKTTAIRVRYVEGERFPTIVGYELGDIPDWDVAETEAIEDEKPADYYEPNNLEEVMSDDEEFIPF